MELFKIQYNYIKSFLTTVNSILKPVFSRFVNEYKKSDKFKEGCHLTIIIILFFVLASLIAGFLYRPTFANVLFPEIIFENNNLKQTITEEKKVSTLIQNYYRQIITELDIKSEQEIPIEERSTGMLYGCKIKGEKCSILDSQQNQGLKTFKLIFVKQVGEIPPETNGDKVFPYRFAATVQINDTGEPREPFTMYGSMNIVENNSKLYIKNDSTFTQQLLCRVTSSNLKIIENKSRFLSSQFNCGQWNNNKPPILEIQN